ncbi:MAG: hypothetical protein K9K76_07160 [Halanaerobiales bacterium]|nr:hypothetical protein [Halanaerobiales bacterium]
MLGGLFETAVGTAMVITPDPVTTSAGLGLMVDGARRTAEKIDENF